MPDRLERCFKAERPDQVWVADITYVPTQQGWLYLAVLLDLFSRRIVGWAMAASLDNELTLRALRMALFTRRPLPGLIHHSDRGSQYTSRDYQHLLQAHEQNPYVWADTMFASSSNQIYVIDKTTLTVTRVITDGLMTLHPELTDDGQFVYISDWQGEVVRVYNAHTFALVAELNGVTTPTGIFNTSRRYEMLGH